MFGRTLAVGVLLATLAAGSANAQEEYEKVVGKNPSYYKY